MKQAQAELYSVSEAGKNGVISRLIKVEVKLLRGLNYFELLGSEGQTLRECKGRVRAAIESAGFTFPRRHITVGLFPAELRKVGSHFDLPIALGILMASGQFRSEEKILAWGELDLNGRISSLPLPMPAPEDIDGAEAVWRGETIGGNIEAGEASSVHSVEADEGDGCAPDSGGKKAGGEYLMICGEGGLTGGIRQEESFCLRDLEQLHVLAQHSTNHISLEDRKQLSVQWNARFLPRKKNLDFVLEKLRRLEKTEDAEEISSVFGQEQALRVLSLGLTSAHPTVFLGAAGCGKSMISRAARRLFFQVRRHEILLDEDYFLRQWNSSDPSSLIPRSLVFSSSVTRARIEGGPRVGASARERVGSGVIFLDELLRFSSSGTEGVKTLLDELAEGSDSEESTQISGAIPYFLAAANPCPCGRWFERDRPCRCEEERIRRYWRKFPAPMKERIHIWLSMFSLPQEQLAESLTTRGESGEERAAKIAEVRTEVRRRAKDLGLSRWQNSCLSVRDLRREELVSTRAAQRAMNISRSFKLSLRSYHHLLRVARSIADFEGHREIETDDLLEAASYRLEQRLAELE